MKGGGLGRALPWLAVLAAALVLGALALAMRPWEPAAYEEPEDPTVLVNDGANWVPIVPAEGVPVSMLQPADFSADGDVIRYTDSDLVALQGIDVSEFQGEIDWQQVKDSGVEFAFLRIGFRGSTEGLLNEDALFRANLEGAQEAGVTVGVYFFSQALDTREAEEEAQFVLELLDGFVPPLPVMFDWEPVETEGSRSLAMGGDTLTACAAAFCDTLKRAGYTAGVYCNRQQGYYLYDLAKLAPYALWISDPNDYPDFYYAFQYWQYSFTGAVPGIDTVVDRDMTLLPIADD